MTKISPPIVYLDQCHWITLAQAQFAKHKIHSSDELAAADFILKAASNGWIRLPLSSAHMVETAKAGNGMRRHQLADTMLSVYDGWHMNNPIAVRGEETFRALGQQEASLERDQVFNQHPGTPFGIDNPYPCSDQTLPPQIQRLVEDLSRHYAWADTLRSDDTYDASKWTAAYEGVQRWAGALRELSSHLKEQPLTKRNLRVLVGMQTLTDLQQELVATVVRVGLSRDELEKCLHSGNFVEFFQQLPFVGRMMEITNIRLRNPQDAWDENDFIDLLFLSCAATYADFVIADRKATHMLRQAAHQTCSGAIVCANLHELHRHLVPDTLEAEHFKI